MSSAARAISRRCKLASVAIGFQPATPASDVAFALKEVTPGTYDVTFRGPEFAEPGGPAVFVDPGSQGPHPVHSGLVVERNRFVLDDGPALDAMPDNFAIGAIRKWQRANRIDCWTNKATAKAVK